MVRGLDHHIDAHLWMESYFGSFDYDPTSKQTHVDVTYKKTFYEEYRDMQKKKSPGCKILTVRAFRNR